MTVIKVSYTTEVSAYLIHLMMHRAFFDDVSMSLFNIEKLLSQLFSNGIQPVSLAMRSVHKIVEEKLKTCSKCSIILSVRLTILWTIVFTELILMLDLVLKTFYIQRNFPWHIIDNVVKILMCVSDIFSEIAPSFIKVKIF